MVLLAKDIMDRNLLTVDEEADALTVAQKMAAARKGYAVLTRGPNATIAGIVTEWDYLEKVVAPGASPAAVRVKSIASPMVHACFPDTPTDEVAELMARFGIRRVVVRAGDQAAGVITSRSVIEVFREYVDKLTAQIAGFHASG